jgi:hypothetical protein
MWTTIEGWTTLLADPVNAGAETLPAGVPALTASDAPAMV